MASNGSSSMIYLDAAATSPVRREVLEAMWPYLTGAFGNASSRHTLGMEAARALGDARQRIAAILDCRPNEIIFTSGGTEADNLAIKGIALAQPRGRRLITSTVEHEAVLASCDFLARHHGFTVDRLPVDAAARIEPASLEQALQHGPEPAVISLMLANNEVGTVEPIAELAALARRAGIPLHTDAVQGCGSLPLRLPELGADAVSLSGHKFGAPKGIGALFLRARVPVEAVLHGGGQERARRSGTENVAGAVAFATALELTAQELPTRTGRLLALRDRLIAGILQAVPGAVLTGDPVHRLPNNASFCFPGTGGESVLVQLEERGILCSSGSACAAGSDEPSHVLTAMGFGREIAQTAVRFSLTPQTTGDDIERTIFATRDAVQAVLQLAQPF